MGDCEQSLKVVSDCLAQLDGMNLPLVRACSKHGDKIGKHIHEGLDCINRAYICLKEAERLLTTLIPRKE
jgi:hypothetical protein